MRTKIALLLLAFAASAALATAQKTRPPRTTLDIYVVDVEGGNSVLFATPSGEIHSFDRAPGTWLPATFATQGALWQRRRTPASRRSIT